MKDDSGRPPRPDRPKPSSKDVHRSAPLYWHAAPAESVIAALGSDPTSGLTEREAGRLLERDGRNVVRVPQARWPLSILLSQFRSLVVILLLAAAAIALLLGETAESGAILIVILLNTAIGFFTELRAERAMASLRKQTAPVARVIRDGRELQIPAEELVVGDVVVISAGERIPADGRILESARLQVQEAAFTGESQPVWKNAGKLPDEKAPLGDRLNMAYLGTVATDGRGLMIVTATGMGTEVGKIGLLLEEAAHQDSPLELRIEQLGRGLLGLVGVLSVMIVGGGYLRGNELLFMLEVGISLAIAAVPEGLPAVASMALAIGVQRMARANALVRRLPAVETLGATTIICTDKTGTLTKNEMTVRRVTAGDQRFVVTGTGYEPHGHFEIGERQVAPESDPVLMLALTIGALCNDADLVEEGESQAVIGDPTEGALLVAAAKAGLYQDLLEPQKPRIAEIPFDSERQFMVTVHAIDAGRVAYVKGAPVAVLERSSQRLDRGGVTRLDAEDRLHLLEANRELANEALRVLAVAYRELPSDDDPGHLDREFIYVGLFGMIDPLREEARVALERCREAGIRTMMITGDQVLTAAAIARDLGIDRDADGRPLRTVHGRDLEGLDAAGRQRLVREAAVFARVSPEHKLHIVEALKRDRQIVAMTGDGLNDAPALRAADIGVAMGIKGTAVAKEAADMIILDDDFGTIVKAVEQGRIIYANIRRFILYLFSCNLSEILTVFVSIMIAWPLPLAPLQILWLNIVTDVFPALALALEPSQAGIMKQPPREPHGRLLDRRLAWLISWQGLLLASVSLAAFWTGRVWYGTTDGLPHAVTLAFTTLALAQIFHALNARSTSRSIFSERPFRNGALWGALVICLGLQLTAVYLPPLHRVLRTVPLTVNDWALVLGLALLPLPVVEMVKLVGRARSRQVRREVLSRQ